MCDYWPRNAIVHAKTWTKEQNKRAVCGCARHSVW